MRPIGPTRIRDLVVAAAVAVALSYALISTHYGSLPALPWTSGAALGCLAGAEGVLARGTRQRILRRPGTKPVEALVVARLVALAKASSVVGAVLVGGWLGAFLYTFPARDRLTAAGGDALVSGLGVAAALMLVGAALWLEQSCRTPPSREDEPQLP